MQTLVALYHNFDDAQKAVDALVTNGVARSKISLLANNATGEYSNYATSEARYDYDSEDAVTAEQGAAFGATSGGIIGALVGLGALAIPGIGAVIAAGPLVAALAGGAIGALAGAPTGGLVGGLIKTHHMDADDAEIYAEGVRRGETLLSVQVEDSEVSRSRDILNQYNPTDVHGEASNWRSTGWSKFDETTTANPDDVRTYRSRTSSSTGLGSSAVVSPSDALRSTDVNMRSINRDFSAYDSDFRSDYQTRYGTSGRAYDVYLPAYQYGYTMASDPLYTSHDWPTFETSARAQWEREHPDTLWDDIKDAAQYAWDKVRGRR